MRFSALVFSAAVAAVASCRTPSTPAPPLSPTPTPTLTPDSAARLRQIVTDSLRRTIAGRENEPAEQVFKNVQLFRGRTAGQLLNIMNIGYGRSLGARCSTCHVATDFASDTPVNKQRARVMQTMVNEINAQHMPKVRTPNPPVVNCMTCHHGLRIPNQSFDAGLPGPYPPLPGARGRGSALDHRLSTPGQKSEARAGSR